MGLKAWLKGKGARHSGLAFYSILDLGTEYVKSLVVGVRDEQVHVIGAARKRREANYAPDLVTTDLVSLAADCDAALRQAEDTTRIVYGRQVVADQAIIGLPGRLVRGANYTVRQRRPRPEQGVTNQELERLLRRVRRLSQQQGPASREGRPEERLLQTTVVELRLDDHLVTDPVGLPGQELSVSVFAATTLLTHLETIDALTDRLQLDPPLVLLEAEAMAGRLGVREAICVDVGGRATEVALIHNGHVVAMAALPWGGSDLVGTGSRPDLRDSPPRLLTWVEGLARQLEGLAGSRELPHDIYLCGGASTIPGLQEALSSFPWLRHLPFGRYPVWHLYGPVDIQAIRDDTGTLREAYWGLPLALASLALRDVQDGER